MRGKKEAVKLAVSEYLHSKRQDQSLETATFTAADEVEASSGNWLPADAAAIRKLNRSCAKSRELLLLVGAAMRLTFNQSTETPTMPRFSQGQLCVIRHLHNQKLTTQQERVRITLLSIGQRSTIAGNSPDDCPTFDVAKHFSGPTVIGHAMTEGRR